MALSAHIHRSFYVNRQVAALTLMHGSMNRKLYTDWRTRNVQRPAYIPHPSFNRRRHCLLQLRPHVLRICRFVCVAVIGCRADVTVLLKSNHWINCIRNWFFFKNSKKYITPWVHMQFIRMNIFTQSVIKHRLLTMTSESWINIFK